MDSQKFIEQAKTSNVLHNFKSFNTLFTLSCLSAAALKNPKKYAESSEKFVVARSYGKQQYGINANDVVPIKRDRRQESGLVIDDETGLKELPQLFDDRGGQSLIKEFNANSGGAYNLYFGDVEIENYMAVDKRTGNTLATEIIFTIIEPYGINGFMEALQAAAVAAGHPTYKSAPFLFRIQFFGYINLDKPTMIEPATRYFVFRFKDIELTINESGSRYLCKGIPMQDFALGEPNRLLSNISVVGNTVEDIVKNLFEAQNESVRINNNVTLSTSVNGNQLQSDEYQVFFPTIDKGVIKETPTNKIAKSKVADLSTDEVHYEFVSPDAKKTSTVANDPLSCKIAFGKGTNIHDAIAAIIRDSEFVRELIRNPANKVDENGRVEYFIINVEVEQKELWDYLNNRPYYIFKYYVLPYRIHYSQIPKFADNFYNGADLAKSIRRSYEYLYTGKNLDILGLQLKLNNLFVQSQPVKGGNVPINGATGSLQNNAPNGNVYQIDITDPVKIARTGGTFPAQTLVDYRSTNVLSAGPSTRPAQADPYIRLAQNLQRSLLDNTALMEIEFDILGDPYYLVQLGQGNQRNQGDPDVPGITITGDADNLFRDTYITITFKNPKDYDNNGVILWATVPSYSGAYKVINVKSKWASGNFTQTLKCLKHAADSTNIIYTAEKIDSITRIVTNKR